MRLPTLDTPHGHDAAAAAQPAPGCPPYSYTRKAARRRDDDGTFLPDDALAGVFARLPHTPILSRMMSREVIRAA